MVFFSIATMPKGPNAFELRVDVCTHLNDSFKVSVPVFRSGCGALVKPDIVFFGEDLPRRFYMYLRDLPMADLLLVMGTSLEVQYCPYPTTTLPFLPRRFYMYLRDLPMADLLLVMGTSLEVLSSLQWCR